MSKGLWHPKDTRVRIYVVISPASKPVLAPILAKDQTLLMTDAIYTHDLLESIQDKGILIASLTNHLRDVKTKILEELEKRQ